MQGGGIIASSAQDGRVRREGIDAVRDGREAAGAALAVDDLLGAYGPHGTRFIAFSTLSARTRTPHTRWFDIQI